MAGKVLNIKVCSSQQTHLGLTEKGYAICHEIIYFKTVYNISIFDTLSPVGNVTGSTILRRSDSLLITSGIKPFDP